MDYIISYSTTTSNANDKSNKRQKVTDTDKENDDDECKIIDIVDLTTDEEESKSKANFPEQQTTVAIIRKIITQVDKDENAIVAKGIYSTLFDSLCASNNQNNIYIACGNDDDYPDLYYYQQTDAWSCGYRNLQMLLSVLIPLVSPNHPYFSSYLNNNNANKNFSIAASTITIPSVSKIQLGIERSWKIGYDKKGANFYNHKIHKRKSKIGAVEVASLFISCNIDCTVVQFKRSSSSIKRSLWIGAFIWNYFSKYYCSSNDSFDIANEIIQTLKSKQGKQQNVCTGDKTTSITTTATTVPLYLQWEGHSILVIGIEKDVSSTASTRFNLLAFDPNKSGSKLKQQLLKNKASLLSKIRFPISKIEHKDVQFILCTKQSLPDVTRDHFKNDIRFVSAA